MANEKAATAAAGFASEEAVAALAVRLTAIEQTLAAKIPGFESVGGRVTELSSAFQQANTRLAAIETAVKALAEAPPPVGAEALQAISDRLDNVSARLGVVEQTRARGGRLSQRLASIEARLPQDGGNTNG